MKPVFQYQVNHTFVKKYKSLAEAARAIGVGESAISAVCSGKRKTAKGFFWSFTKMEEKESKVGEYRDIKGYNGKYQISLDGKVWKKEHIDKGGRVMPSHYVSVSIDSCGYLYCSLEGERKRIHRLLYEAFVGEIPKGMVIDHINRNRLDNRLENLRIVSPAFNVLNRTLAYKPSISNVEKYYKGNKIKKPFQLRFSENGKRKNIGYYETYEEAEKEYQRLYNNRQKKIDYACS